MRYSLLNPNAYVDSNLVGFVNVLEGCRQHAIQYLVYASSSSAYGGNTRMPFAERDNVDHPVSLYAATKKANELMAHTYSHLYRLPTTGLRFFTVYGPWGGPTWRFSCSPGRSSKTGRSTSSTTAACSATSPTWATSSSRAAGERPGAGARSRLHCRQPRSGEQWCAVSGVDDRQSSTGTVDGLHRLYRAAAWAPSREAAGADAAGRCGGHLGRHRRPQNSGSTSRRARRWRKASRAWSMGLATTTRLERKVSIS